MGGSLFLGGLSLIGGLLLQLGGASQRSRVQRPTLSDFVVGTQLRLQLRQRRRKFSSLVAAIGAITGTAFSMIRATIFSTQRH